MAFLSGCLTPQEESYGIRTLQFARPDGHVDLVVRRQERNLELKAGAGETRSEETIIEESLSLKTEGSVFHPNVIELALGGVFGLVQEHFEDVIDGQKRDSSHSGDLLEFDLDAQILKRRPYPMTLFAHRRRDLAPRPFRPSLESTTTDYGLTWQYVSKKVPTSLRFSHAETTLSPVFIGDVEEEGRQETTELRFQTEYHRSDHETLSFVYAHESFAEEPYKIEYDADEVTLTHQLAFGGGLQHLLRSELNYLDQRGTIALERCRWREDLRFKHSDSLESRFQFEALDRSRGSRSSDVPSVEERSYRFSGLLQHQLYDSQTVRLQGFAQRQEFQPDLQITRSGGQFNFNYRKTNRWGTLHANYGAHLERSDHRGTSRTAEVIDEMHTFRDPDPLTLTNQNIIVSSVTVRAEDRMTYYQHGRDFLRRAVGNVVEIERNPTGRIADGGTVLIDYLYTVGGTYELDTVRQHFGMRQDFDFGLTPYYHLEWQDQSISPEDSTSTIAEDITAHTAGVEYEKSSMRLFAEYERRDSTINPFASSRLGASYTHRFESGPEASLYARWTDTTYDLPDARDVTLLTLEGRCRYPITSSLTVEGSVHYRNGEDTLSGDIEGIDTSFSLEWFFHQMEVRMSFEYSDFEDEYARSESSGLYFHLRRGI